MKSKKKIKKKKVSEQICQLFHDKTPLVLTELTKEEIEKYSIPVYKSLKGTY